MNNKLLAVALCAIAVHGHLYDGSSPPPGSLWPKPQVYNPTNKVLEVQPNYFYFLHNVTDCDLVEKAVDRYRKLIFPQKEVPARSKYDLLTSLNIVVQDTSDCGYPLDSMVESYEIAYNINNELTLTSATPWGVIRGLETFSQMIYIDETTNNYLINLTYVKDFPRFKHRMVLFDTSRHFLPTRLIKQHLDAMAYHKFNVFHWHIVDLQSWPLQLKTYPNLTQAAYHPRMVYTQEEIKDIIEFSRERGIRVLPEIDTPGHSDALLKMLPELSTPCTTGTPLLNVARDYTYEVVNKIVAEVFNLFPDTYFHLGMDEVDYTCWQNSDEITRFMKANNLTTYAQLEQHYVKRTLDNVRKLGAKYVIWQDPINNGVVAANDTIVGVWLPNYSTANSKHGYQIILSAPWYLDLISYGEDWKKYYTTEPTEYPAVAAEADLIVGGETCLWSEYVDVTNGFARMWPRASAVAERLWSAKEVNDANEARGRLDEQRCRLLRRGLPAQPLYSGYCGAYELNF